MLSFLPGISSDTAETSSHTAMPYRRPSFSGTIATRASSASSIMERMCGFASKDAHATAISIMLPLTFASAAVYCAGGGVDWHTLLFAAPGAILGSIAGAKLTGRIKSAALDKLFAAVMFCAGVWMLL